MQDKNFEKLVQKKMGELRFSPSETVWPKIEERIKKDKRRRAAFLLFFGLFVALVAGGYFILTNKKQTPIQNIIATSNENSSVKLNQSNSNPASNHQTTNAEQNSVKTTEIIRTEPELQFVNQLQPQKKEALKSISKNSTNEQHITSLKDLDKQNLLQNHTNETQKTIPINEPVKNENSEFVKKDVASNSTIESKEQKTETDQIISQNIDTVINDKVSKSEGRIMDEKKTDSIINNTDSKIVKKENSKNKNKWHIGFVASSGLSSLKEGFLNLGEEKNLIPGLPIGSVALPILQTSVKSSLSFSIGTEAQKQIGKKLKISIGLQYLQYSTKISLGNSSSTSGAFIINGNVTTPERYYQIPSNTDANSYTNHYHFIYMPVNILWQFNKSKKNPLYFSVGISGMYLMASNALILDKTNRVYYSNNNYLNKFQIGIQSGFLVQMPLFKQSSLQLGPEIRYNFSKAQKSLTKDNSQFSFAGLKVVFMLQKK